MRGQWPDGGRQARRRRTLAAVGLVLAGFLSAAVTAQPSAAQGAVLRGTVSAAGQRLADAHDRCLHAGSRTTVEQLATSATDSDGSFELSYDPPAGGVIYVEVTSPASPALMLRSVVGVLADGGGVASRTVSTTSVNELTTVATAFALARVQHPSAGSPGPAQGWRTRRPPSSTSSTRPTAPPVTS